MLQTGEDQMAEQISKKPQSNYREGRDFPERFDAQRLCELHMQVESQVVQLLCRAAVAP